MDLSRRSMIAGSFAAGAVIVTGACSGDESDDGGSSASTAPGATQTTASDGATVGHGTAENPLPLFDDDDLTFEALYTLGAAGYGGAEVGEVITAVNDANAAGGSYQGITDAFEAQSAMLQKSGAEAEDAGHLVTARDQYLRAAEYLATPLFFVLGTSTPEREPEVFSTLRTYWERSNALFDPAIEKVAIPYEGSDMPGYLVKAPGPGRKPTVIVNNGSDGQSVETYAWGGRAAADRGWNALLLEGPGQGAMLFERKIPFRGDWENVITPVIDYLVTRDDVDPERIALTGWSMGGMLTARAAAFEPRLRALVTDPGGVDAWAAFPEEIRQIAEAGDAQTVNQIWNDEVVPSYPQDEIYTSLKRFEIFTTQALEEARQGKLPTDFYAVAQAAQAIRCDDVAHQITCPTLVIDYEGEAFYVGQAQQLYDLLTTEKQMVKLDSTNGAQLHCAPMAPQYRNEVVYDYLDDVTS